MSFATSGNPAPPAALRSDVSLAPLSTIGIGGPAKYYAEAHNAADVRECLTWAASQQMPVLVLGGGSNLLCADAGYDGLVLRVVLKGIEETEGENGARVLRAGAGENWDEFVSDTVQRDLQGVECLSGIPGTVGASPIQNIGAYGQEVKDTIATVEAVDRETGEVRIFTNTECEFGYRMSRFKVGDKDRYVVTAVSFKLMCGGRPALRYGDLTRHFAALDVEEPTLGQVRQAVLQIRSQKAMVLDPEEPNSRSCGSFFTNPIIPRDVYEKVRDVAAREGLLAEGEKMPVFDAGEGYKKLSAAWLMERAGLRKGLRMGNVGLSEKHVLAVVNCGNGTAAEVLELVRHVQATVSKRFGVHLEPEPVFVGFSQNG